MSLSTEIRHGASAPNSLRRDQLYIQHSPTSQKILALWLGSRNDKARVIVPKAVVFPGDGVSYQVKPEDKHVGMDTSTAIATATLPDPADINDGHEVVIEDHGGNSGVNAITIATPGAETVETGTISTNDAVARLMWDAENTNWKAL